jgi:arginyl-tRNA synthetase
MPSPTLKLPEPRTPPHFAAIADIIAQSIDGSLDPQFRSIVLRNLEPSARPEYGEIAFKTFFVTKYLGISPQHLANRIRTALLARSDVIRSISVDLPYINISLNYSMFSSVLEDPISYTRSSITKSQDIVVVEHTQPNTHKELHVGHLRNTILGDSLYRLLQCFFEKTFVVDYHGDEGVHVARVIWYIKKHYKIIPDISEPGAWLGEIYPKAVAEIESASGTEVEIDINRAISSILKNIEDKSGEDFELWLKTRNWSLDYFAKIYNWLHVSFDSEFCESDMSAASQRRVDQFLAKGVFIVSNGAIGCDLSEYGLGFCLLRKRDGTGLYATKDVELLIERYNQYKFSTCIYVVDNRQQRHFEQVFKTVAKMGFEFGGRCVHLGYDVVQTRDGPISSRKGSALAAHLVIDELTRVARGNIELRIENRGFYQEDMLSDAASRVALAALRYGMLKVDPDRKITFDLDEWVSFEGNTGPYLLYTFARIRSILRKYEREVVSGGSHNSRFLLQFLTDDRERMLLNSILRTPAILHESAIKMKPNILCNFVYDVAQVFNSYYNQVRILAESDAMVREGRILLLRGLEAFYRYVFAMLGFDPVERL